MDDSLKELKKKFYELSQETITSVDESGKEQKPQKKYNRYSPEYKIFQEDVTKFNESFLTFYESIKSGINSILNKFLTGEKLNVELIYKTPLDTDPIYEWKWNQCQI